MRYIVSITLVILFIPNIVLAAWWNPFSWFQVDSRMESSESKVGLKESVQHSSSSIESNNYEEIVIDQEASSAETKIITVTDPSLQSKINSLIAENESLKIQIGVLKEKLESGGFVDDSDSNIADYQTIVKPYLDELRDIRNAALEWEEYINDDKKDGKICYENSNFQGENGVIVPRCSQIPEKILDLKTEEEELLQKIDEIKIEYAIPS